MEMRRFLLAGALLAAAAAPALAADLARPAPVYVPPPVLVPVWSWTGFYIGGNAGYAWGHFDPTSSFACPTGSGAISCAYSFPANLAVVSAAATGAFSPNAFTGGIQAGFNWQVGAAVFGIESDFNAFHLSSSLSAGGAFPLASTNFAVNASAHTDWLYTLRGRLGWAVIPTALVYATGGLAVTKVNVSNTFTDNFVPVTVGASSSSTTRAGWTLGGGAELGLNHNWTVKAEYLYVDFGSAVGTTLTTNTIPAVLGPDLLTTSTRLHANIVRFGLNYKFGG
jgi:outer membrane immunogenic protein